MGAKSKNSIRMSIQVGPPSGRQLLDHAHEPDEAVTSIQTSTGIEWVGAAFAICSYSLRELRFAVFAEVWAAWERSIVPL